MTRQNLAAVVLLALAAAAPAQPGEGDQGRSYADMLEQADRLDPPRRLGMRTALLASVRPTIPDLVVVPNPGAYLAAIERWSPQGLFPVLIDDGTTRAGEDIARFVRAFEPRRIVRWNAGDRLPPRGQQRRRAVEIAVARAWGIQDERPTQPAVIEFWLANDVRPPGIVVADDADPAWTAALALAAARAQPIAWIQQRGNVGGVMSEAEADALRARIRAECQATGLAWDALGDDIDAVTICQSLQSKVESGDNLLATTDLVGRDADDPRARWAWTGQVFGNHARAAYAAMCALFLETDSAWLFDGYPDRGAFADYDMTRAGAALAERDIKTNVLDQPNATADVWRREAAGALDADLVLVNTQGMRTFFELNPGRAHAGDVPLLARPAMVYFVHSWSASSVINRATVGARWIERGAYAYLGSVQEPYLQAFVPTPLLAARLVHAYPWGAAVRINDAPPWKLACFGDPLAMVSGTRRVEADLPLKDATPLDDRLQNALDEERFDDAVRTLVLLGRDDDAARLALGVLHDRPGALSPEAAAGAIPAAFRAGQRKDLLELYQTLPASVASDPVLRDVLWLAAGAELARTNDEDLVALLRTNLRDDQLAADAIALAPAVARLYDTPAAASMLAGVRQQTTAKREREELDEAMRRYGG